MIRNFTLDVFLASEHGCRPVRYAGIAIIIGDNPSIPLPRLSVDREVRVVDCLFRILKLRVIR